MSEETYDLIVIGAGINGAGIARDAARRGLKVLLVDKGDIGGGTSSWSTRLIHGGLRYLEQGEFGLVRESLRERETLFRIAPHLVTPLPMLIPLYRDARRGPWTVRAGMIAYDLLATGKRSVDFSLRKPWQRAKQEGQNAVQPDTLDSVQPAILDAVQPDTLDALHFEAAQVDRLNTMSSDGRRGNRLKSVLLPWHRMLSRQAALELAPGLNSAGLLGAALYYDAQVEFAERLVLENALAAQSHHAVVRTYTRVDRFVVANDQVIGVELSDELSQEHYSARGQVVINAAGPWVDEVVRETAATRMIGGTKGSHIVVAPFPGAPSTALYVEAKVDRRPFFIIPWNGNFLIGTTDKRFDGNLDAVRIDESEIDYLLNETNRVIPDAKLRRGSIRFAYSGVRPLPFTADQREQSITRRHFIHKHERLTNLFSIVGGKLTTYRSLSEEAVDLVFKTLGPVVPACVTHLELLPGAAPSELNISVARDGRGAPRCPPASLEQTGYAGPPLHFEELRRQLEQNQLTATTIDHLLRVYGARASDVLEAAAGDRTLREVFDEETGAIAAEVVFAFQHEMAKTLADCLLRRTMVGLNSSAGKGADEAAAKVAQRHLGWSVERVDQELRDYRLAAPTSQ